MKYIPVNKDILKLRLERRRIVVVYRISDMIPFQVTGIGENVFILKDRHGLEHTRQFNGPWLLGVEND